MLALNRTLLGFVLAFFIASRAAMAASPVLLSDPAKVNDQISARLRSWTTWQPYKLVWRLAPNSSLPIQQACPTTARCRISQYMRSIKPIFTRTRNSMMWQKASPTTLQDRRFSIFIVMFGSLPTAWAASSSSEP